MNDAELYTNRVVSYLDARKPRSSSLLLIYKTKLVELVLSHREPFDADTHDSDIGDERIRVVETCKLLQVSDRGGRHFVYQFSFLTNQTKLQ